MAPLDSDRMGFPAPLLLVGTGQELEARCRCYLHTCLAYLHPFASIELMHHACPCAVDANSAKHGRIHWWRTPAPVPVGVALCALRPFCFCSPDAQAAWNPAPSKLSAVTAA